MSYVAIGPAYYAPLQWNSPFHVGAPGWWSQNVPGWGENPNNAWSKMQAQNGLGEEKPACTPPTCPPPPGPPPFSWVGKVPFPWYLYPGIAAWGRFPRGPAYASPKPAGCPGCIGTGIKPGVGSVVEASRAINAGDMLAAVRALKNAAVQGLSGGCGPCEISAGDRCLPCPEGADVDECAGCAGGGPKAAWYDHPLAGPVVVGVATAVATGIVLSLLRSKTKIPVE